MGRGAWSRRGHVAFLDGRDYSADIRDGYLLSAANEATWGTVAARLDFLTDAATPSDS